MQHIYSFFDNEQECLQAILQIHNDGNGIELDPMYNKGKFYKTLIDRPPLRFDLNAYKCGYDAVQGDAAHLPVESESVRCMILDPPFMFGAHGQTGNSPLTKRYTMFENFAELKACYQGILREAHRVLKKNGLLIFKCQDYTDNRTTMTHCLVWLWATHAGFYAKDIAVLNLPMNKLFNGSLKQRHLRKSHCYFWVFQKGAAEKNTAIETSKERM